MTEDSLTKGERTRRAIMDAAYRLFADQGFHATSMREIAGRAGLALGGIYNHFDSKEQIFEAVLIEQHPYKHVLTILNSTSGDTVEEFVRRAARTIANELGKRPDFLKLAFVELSEFKGAHATLLYRTIFPQVLPLIVRLQGAEGQLRNLQPETVLFSMLGVFFAFYIDSVVMNPQGAAHPDQAALEQFVDILLHGIIAGSPTPPPSLEQL